MATLAPKNDMSMKWTPIPLKELDDLIDTHYWCMEPEEREFWSQVKVAPVKCQLDPWGRHGGGFFIVGILGARVIWYNDIEEGFNISQYSNFGVIDEYLCEQLELHYVIKRLRDEIKQKC